MKKITTEEEREQLRSEADFLEGFFSVRYAMSRENNILEVLLVVLSFLSPFMVEEVLFCATSRSSVIKPSGSGKSRCSTKICYYEWNGRSFERNWCIPRQNLKWEYGDILIKKYDRLWRTYFQVKEGKNK